MSGGCVSNVTIHARTVRNRTLSLLQKHRVEPRPSALLPPVVSRDNRTTTTQSKRCIHHACKVNIQCFVINTSRATFVSFCHQANTQYKHLRSTQVFLFLFFFFLLGTARMRDVWIGNNAGRFSATLLCMRRRH